MRNFYSIIVLMIMPIALFAQYSKVDSLQNIIKILEPTDTNYIHAHFDLGRILINNIPEQALKYLDKGICALEVNPTESKKINLLDFLYMKARLYIKTGDYDSVYPLLDRIKNNLHLATDRERLQVRIINILGDIARDNNDYELSKEYYREGLDSALYYNNSSLIELNYNKLAIVFDKEEKIDSATYYLIESSKLNDIAKDKVGMIYNYVNIATLYQKAKNNTQALKYYNKVLENKEYITNRKIIPFTYNGIGDLFTLDGNNQEALSHYKKGLIYADSLGIQGMSTNINMSIGKIHINNKEYELAGNYVNQAYFTSTQRQDSVGIYQSGILATIIAAKSNDAKKAQLIFDKVMHLYSSGVVSKAEKKTSIDLLIRAAATIGDYQLAFELQQVSSDKKEKQLQKERELAALDMQTQYEAELDSKTKTLKIIALEKEKENTQLIYSLGVIALIAILIILFIVLSNNKQKQKTNKALAASNKALKQANRIAENAVKQKENFLSTMSHEIRTPMNAVIGMTDILLDESPRRDQIQNLKTLKFSGQNLLHIINDVLDLSKMEAGKITLLKKPFVLRTLFQSIYDTFLLNKKIHNNQISLKLNIEGKPIERYILGDTTRLTQIFTNLIGNAVKFTETGSIEIIARVTSIENNEANFYFAVKDTGIGIAKDRQEAIFDVYTQATESTTQKYGGTGLGLSITKRLIELMGSEICLDSEEGKGSTFYFTTTLPLGDNIPSKEPSQITTSIHKKGLEGVRVLVAEDNEINQLVIKKILQKWLVNLTVVENGLEALKKCQREQFDIILMDIHMPKMNGIEATKSIRSLSNPNHSIPIIALTASVISSTEAADVKSIINKYVSKPFVPKELFEVMLQSLDQESDLPQQLLLSQ